MQHSTSRASQSTASILVHEMTGAGWPLVTCKADCISDLARSVVLEVEILDTVDDEVRGVLTSVFDV